MVPYWLIDLATVWSQMVDDSLISEISKSFLLMNDEIGWYWSSWLEQQTRIGTFLKNIQKLINSIDYKIWALYYGRSIKIFIVDKIKRIRGGW